MFNLPVTCNLALLDQNHFPSIQQPSNLSVECRLPQDNRTKVYLHLFSADDCVGKQHNLCAAICLSRLPGTPICLRGVTIYVSVSMCKPDYLSNFFGDSKSYLSGLPWATHKCGSLFWQIFLVTFWECRKVITHKCPCINVYPTSHLCVVLHVLIFYKNALDREKFHFNK